MNIGHILLSGLECIVFLSLTRSDTHFVCLAGGERLEWHVSHLFASPGSFIKYFAVL